MRRFLKKVHKRKKKTHPLEGKKIREAKSPTSTTKYLNIKSVNAYTYIYSLTTPVKDKNLTYSS